MNSMLPYFITLFAALCVGGLAWHALCLARQMTYVTLADGRRQQRSIPLLFRLLLPLAPNLRRPMGSAGLARSRELADGMIVTAGFEGLLEGWELLALKALVPVCVGPFVIIAIHVGATASAMLHRLAPMLDIIVLLLLYMMPVMWLKGAVRKRQREIVRAMPFMLDLLTLSVEAGMDFMSAMQRNVEQRKIDALGEEMMRVVREIQLGSTRKAALKAMSARVALPDMRSVVNALVQADELGVSIGSILRIQSDQIRLRRFEKAEKLANEAAVKLLGPLLIFIFPTVFLILLGPSIYRLFQII